MGLQDRDYYQREIAKKSASNTAPLQRRALTAKPRTKKQGNWLAALGLFFGLCFAVLGFFFLLRQVAQLLK